MQEELHRVTELKGRMNPDMQGGSPSAHRLCDRGGQDDVAGDNDKVNQTRTRGAN